MMSDSNQPIIVCNIELETVLLGLLTPTSTTEEAPFAVEPVIGYTRAFLDRSIEETTWTDREHWIGAEVREILANKPDSLILHHPFSDQGSKEDMEVFFYDLFFHIARIDPENQTLLLGVPDAQNVRKFLQTCAEILLETFHISRILPLTHSFILRYYPQNSDPELVVPLTQKIWCGSAYIGQHSLQVPREIFFESGKNSIVTIRDEEILRLIKPQFLS